MDKKHLITIFCIAVGGSDFLAVSLWPQYARAIEMTLYTIMVFGVLVSCTFGQRKPPCLLDHHLVGDDIPWLIFVLNSLNFSIPLGVDYSSDRVDRGDRNIDGDGQDLERS